MFIMMAFIAISSINAQSSTTISNKWQADGLNVDFVGDSPKFKLWTSDQPNSFIMVTMGNLVETDPQNPSVTNQIHSLANEPGLNFSGIYKSIVNASNEMVNITTVSFSGSPVQYPGCYISILTQLSTQQMTVPYGNGTDVITIPQNSLKWSINITNWPFVYTRDSLILTLYVVSPTTGSLQKSATNGTFSIPSYPGQTLIFDNPEYAIIDGVKTNITITASGNQLIFKFPSFQSLYYDPSFYFASTTNPTTSSGNSRFLMNVLYIVLAICGFLMIM
jgi:hypothetical protein